MNARDTAHADLHVSFSIHCFTEEFNQTIHLDHHTYTHENETRAFELTRYNCSLQLPTLIDTMFKGKVYRAKNNNYTYVAQIALNGQSQPYSIFFDLKKDTGEVSVVPTLRMYVQSAYMKPLQVSSNASNWRFGSLAGQIAGVFEKSVKKTRPKKKKTP
ncbi:hypothetical protein [Rhodoferax sp.]|uniref:hypothetical protein n=1 Tax=Rhodoferax sp. TaxID=50421 RepID=UPI002624C153|nr:hypothetical protein [Rhodoferax sp.]